MEERDARLAQALEAAQSHGLKLNAKKCEFRKVVRSVDSRRCPDMSE